MSWLIFGGFVLFSVVFVATLIAEAVDEYRK